MTPAVEHHPLRPFLPPHARLLMLGSFPPPRQRWSMDFFYPNRTNMMWEIFGEVFFGDPSRLVDVANKGFRQNDIERLLNERGVALFDTATVVRRLANNASDKFLEVVEKTDVAALLEWIPLCHDVVCTGQKSAETLCADYGASVPRMGEYSRFMVGSREMRMWRMPSSSRAYPMPLSEKAVFYREMMRQVGILEP